MFGVMLFGVSTGEATVDPSPFQQHQQIDGTGTSPSMMAFSSEQDSVSIRSPADMPQPSYSYHLGSHRHSPDRSPMPEWDDSNPHSRGLQTLQQCTLAMAVRDSNRDDQLSQDEFVNFLNQLFGNQYANTPYQSLPCELQDIFSEYADSGTSTINVQGTKPGQILSTAQEERINALCTEIITIVDTDPPASSGTCAGDDSSPGGSPVASPPDDGGAGEADCAGTIQRAQCNTALAIADLSRDEQMDQGEYVRFVNRLSSNAYRDAAFGELPSNVQDNFGKFTSGASNTIDLTGSKPGQTPTAAQDVFIGALCCETDLAIQNPGAPVAGPTGPPSDSPGGGGDGPDCTGTIPQTQCNTALSIADISRDNLMNEAEYVRFVNRLSNNEYQGFTFDALPASLRSNYDKFAVTSGQVDISGSKPGQTPTAAQAEFLASLCCETDLTVDNPDQGGGEPSEPSPSPPTASSPPTYLPRVCRTAMASSDFNRDDKLNQDEYVRFLNRLTQNQYQGLAFSALSTVLQNNFVDNAQAGNDEINIFGSKPGQSPSSAQTEFLDDFCLDTAVAIQEDDSGGPQPSAPPAETAPTAAPTPADGGGSSQPPTFPDNLCRTAMATSDLNRDAYLNEEEYVRFLNRLTQNEFADDTFETLEVPLPQTYDKLTDDTGQIWIFGAMPGQDATDEQEAFLLEICFEVSIALSQLGETLAPVAPPSAGPVAPTLPPGVAEVYSSFIISNSRRLTASDLETGPDREGLDNAYGAFAEQAVDTISQTRRILQKKLRARRLAVNFVTGSDEIYLLLDDDCPDDLDRTETCQTAFAKFLVQLDDDEDPQQISDDYSEATQVLIAEGVLQDVLTAEDPRNGVEVVDASFPLTSTLPPTAAPLETEAPAAPTGGGGGGGGNDDNGGGSAAGAIVGGIFGGIALCAVIGWASSKFGKKNGSKGLDDDDMEKGDDDASDGEKENGFGLGGDKDDSDKGDNAFGDKPEQPQDTKNKFGFGKKNKQNDDDNAFGIDAAPTNGTFGEDENMELFAFDEPSVARDNGDGQDGSVAEKENAFGATDSGWGNTTNAASGFFGNDGGGWGGDQNGGTDNFFGASGFDGEVPQESSGSRSGSESGSGEGSYTSSEDSTYESGNPDGDEEGDEDEDEASGSYSRSSADEGSSHQSGSGSKSDGMGDDGNWDGIAAAADSFDGSSIEGSSKRSALKDNSLTDGSDVEEDEDSFSGSESGSGSGSGSATTASTRTEDREKRAEYQAQVEALVRLVLPDEVEKVDAMMEQFKGREAELVSTLQTMQERSATQRARAAVHKSKTRPQRGEDGTFALSSGLAGGAEGAAAGTAAIAAASLPIPAEGMFEEGEGDFGGDQDQMGFGNEDAFGGGDDEPYDDKGEGSFYDDEEGSRSHSGSGSRSYYSGEDSRGSQSGSGSRSGSGSGSRSGSRSYYSGEEGSQVSGSQGSRSYYSGEDSRGSQSGSGSRSRSQYSGEEGSRSQYSGEEGSFVSGEEGSQSQYSGEEGSQGSRSQHSGEEGSFISGEEGSQGSRSQYSGEEGSHVSGEEGSQSQHSGEEGSQGSRSQYSGEEGSQSQGSRSYYSGEEGEEGSYISGEGDEEGSFAD
jgi:hypothetical protein